MTENPMSIGDFLCYLRQQLIESREEDSPNSHEVQTKLLYTLTALDEATAHVGDSTYTRIIEDLINAIQHTFLAEFKISIPSEEDIRKLG